MRRIISLILLAIVAIGIMLSLAKIPFGEDKIEVGKYYLSRGIEETGAVNIVTSVVLNYRGFDTLGEVTVLFVAAIGLGAILYRGKKKAVKGYLEPASLILYTGCRFLFPLILLFGTYIFLHGHLTPGGGFQGGAIIASGFLLVYLCSQKGIMEKGFRITESLGGLIFVIIGLIGLSLGGYFLSNFLPKGIAHTLFSAGIIPILYITIGFKVGSELAGILYNLMERGE